MIRDRGAFETDERVRRELAAQDRLRAVREVYAGYHRWDWKAALLADLMMDALHMKGDRSDGLEMDIARAEPVAGARFQGGVVAWWRKRWLGSTVTSRTTLRDPSERQHFDYGLYRR